MKFEKWLCIKCQHNEYENEEIRVVGGFWSKIFNVQTKKYASIICKKCTYTEFYKKRPSSTLSNIFDFFTN